MNIFVSLLHMPRYVQSFSVYLYLCKCHIVHYVHMPALWMWPKSVCAHLLVITIVKAMHFHVYDYHMPHLC